MAGLSCNKCDYGIHDSGPSKGLILQMFPICEWNRLIKSNLPVSRYTLDDGALKKYEIWKCPKCETFHLFEDDSIILKLAYGSIKNISNNVNLSNSVDGLLFDDVTWDYITEFDLDWKDTKKKCEELNYKIECKYVRFNDEYILVYSDEDYKNLDSVYKRLEEELE